MFSHAFNNLDPRKWFDKMHPQTLAIATWLLYLDGVFGIIGYLDKTNDFGILRRISPVMGVIGLVACLGYFGGAYLMANGKKLGWYVAVGASFSPIVARLLISFEYSITLRTIITGGDLIGFMFEAALAGLLLHPMSRSYARTWLR